MAELLDSLRIKKYHSLLSPIPWNRLGIVLYLKELTIMEGAVLAVVLQVAGGVVLVSCIIIVWRAQGYLAVTVERGCNDDDSATDMFLDLVNNAKREMIIHDDGDDTETSIYNNDEVIEAVERRLQSESPITVKCLFNKKDNIRILRLRDEYRDRFLVEYRQVSRSDSDIHYKIVDGGRKGYLSTHRVGSHDREYEMIDCTKAKQKIQRRTFRTCLRQFDQEFRPGACVSKVK